MKSSTKIHAVKHESVSRLNDIVKILCLRTTLKTVCRNFGKFSLNFWYFLLSYTVTTGSTKLRISLKLDQIAFFFFYNNKKHPLTNYKVIKNKSNKKRKHRTQNLHKTYTA